MTNTIITNLIDEASAKLGEVAGTSPHGITLYVDAGSARAETQHGLVECFVLTTDKHRQRERHIKTTFKLNGKVISRANLEKALSEQS